MKGPSVKKHLYIILILSCAAAIVSCIPKPTEKAADETPVVCICPSVPDDVTVALEDTGTGRLYTTQNQAELFAVFSYRQLKNIKTYDILDM